MKITNILIAVVIFSMVGMAFSGMYINMASTYSDYGVGDPTQMGFLNNTMTSINTTMINMEQSMEDAQIYPSYLLPFVAPLSATRMLFDIPGIFSGLFTDITTLEVTTGTGANILPSWFPGAMLIITVIIVVMGIVATFMKWKP